MRFWPEEWDKVVLAAVLGFILALLAYDWVSLYGGGTAAFLCIITALGLGFYLGKRHEREHVKSQKMERMPHLAPAEQEILERMRAQSPEDVRIKSGGPKEPGEGLSADEHPLIKAARARERSLYGKNV